MNTAIKRHKNNHICSSSCTEPQGCCCERSEQQQTCYIVIFTPDTCFCDRIATSTMLSKYYLSPTLAPYKLENTLCYCFKKDLLGKKNSRNIIQLRNENHVYFSLHREVGGVGQYAVKIAMHSAKGSVVQPPP